MRRFAVLFLAIAAMASAQSVSGRAARVQFEKLSKVVASSTLDVQAPSPSKHTVQVTTSGSPAGCSIRLEGSLDGTTWADLSGSQTCTSSITFHVVDKPVDYVRINLTALSGGTNPSVTVNYLGVQ